MWKNFTDAFYLNFISDDRWHYIADGLKTTLIITFFACMMGIVLGFIVGMIRSTHDKTGNLKLLNILCKIYLTVIRGTPVVVQLLIIYFVVFGSTRIDKVPVAIMHCEDLLVAESVLRNNGFQVLNRLVDPDGEAEA